MRVITKDGSANQIYRKLLKAQKERVTKETRFLIHNIISTSCTLVLVSFGLPATASNCSPIKVGTAGSPPLSRLSGCSSCSSCDHIWDRVSKRVSESGRQMCDQYITLLKDLSKKGCPDIPDSPDTGRHRSGGGRAAGRPGRPRRSLTLTISRRT